MGNGGSLETRLEGLGKVEMLTRQRLREYDSRAPRCLCYVVNQSAPTTHVGKENKCVFDGSSGNQYKSKIVGTTIGIGRDSCGWPLAPAVPSMPV